MNSLGILNKSKVENEYMKTVSKEKIALCNDEQWEYIIHDNVDDFIEYLDTNPILHVAYIDVTLDGAIEVAERIRRENKNVAILLIADATVSPMRYIKPSIMAASLVLRPMKKKEVQEQIHEIMHLFSDKSEDTKGYFSVEYKGEKMNIPYERILYFEARDKKIFLGLENTEYGFYDTISSLEKKLPDYFCKCHRGIIFNQKKLVKVSWEEDMIELESGITLPMSRRCRKAIKEL
ncbi:MAG: LytTR family transcriptional regulator DNA-binding domain-containing protein [Lachnospiraceae bacterium]|nr:LytTR family transcriptional regulator DNA-binding domain-containing protein [Lachnospiraceae bacterium]